MHFSQRTFEADYNICDLVVLQTNVQNVSACAKYFCSELVESGVLYWTCVHHTSVVISVSFVVEINVSPLNWQMETFENIYHCPMVMLSFHTVKLIDAVLSATV